MQPTNCPGSIAPCMSTAGTWWTKPKRSSAVQKAPPSAGNRESKQLVTGSGRRWRICCTNFRSVHTPDGLGWATYEEVEKGDDAGLASAKGEGESKEGRLMAENKPFEIPIRFVGPGSEEL